MYDHYVQIKNSADIIIRVILEGVDCVFENRFDALVLSVLSEPIGLARGAQARYRA